MKNFKSIYDALRTYKEQKGNLRIRRNYVTNDGIKLGIEFYLIRCGYYTLRKCEEKKLADIGFVLKSKPSKKAKRVRKKRKIVSAKTSNRSPNSVHKQKNKSTTEILDMLEQYVAEYGDCNVPDKYVTPDGYHLGKAIQHIRSGRRKMTPQERRRLKQLGFKKHLRTCLTFPQLYGLLYAFYKEHGHCKVPCNYVVFGTIKLGGMVKEIRYGRRKLKPEQIDDLNKLGFVWEKPNYHRRKKESEA